MSFIVSEIHTVTHKSIPISNDCSSPTTQWLRKASNQWEAGVNTLEDGMEEESSTKDVCNAIRMNKGLFNEEASLPLMLPLPIQLFHYSEWEVRAAGLQSWVYWRLRLTRSKHNQITSQMDICYDLTSRKGHSLPSTPTAANIHCWFCDRFFQGMLDFFY